MPDGSFKKEIIGNYNGVYKFHCVVPAGAWFTFRHQTVGEEQYTLFSSAVVPAMESASDDVLFDHSKHIELVDKYPFTPYTGASKRTPIDLAEVPERFGMFKMATCGYLTSTYASDSERSRVTASRQSATAVLDFIVGKEMEGLFT